MKVIRVQDAAGHALCHDLTRIVKDEYKGPQFRKGHIVTPEDIPLLLSMGKEHLYVWEMKPGMVHEDDAARRLAKICLADGMSASEVREGKIELRAERDGLFLVDVEKLNAINSIGQLAISTRHGNSPVTRSDKLAGMRIIPLAVDGAELDRAEKAAGGTPILSLLPYKLRRAGMVVTGSEVKTGRIEDTFSPVIKEKLRKFGIEITAQLAPGDDPEDIVRAIAHMRQKPIDFLLCTGGMSVDPDDNTPGAIKRSGARIVTYGTPVLPGSMFLLGYYDDGLPVVGLPGCVMYAKVTVFDIVLPRIAAGVRVDKKDFVAMGHGGLCCGCPACTFPICPFGK